MCFVIRADSVKKRRRIGYSDFIKKKLIGIRPVLCILMYTRTTSFYRLTKEKYMNSCLSILRFLSQFQNFEFDMNISILIFTIPISF